jgi:selenocysteine-specific elongation factor
MRRLILGTAGHIDHGKTELVRALTGVDTDRLKEEKERGITIDLGFAELPVGDDLRLGVVDVPGHEGFIRNMLAGATGMDVVLLVVAADEGIMPQTLEHLAIVSLLGVERLVVAITKVDLVDEDWLALVSDEIATRLAETPYASAPRVPTSARTGFGLGELVETLRSTASAAEADESRDVARLPIDRVFTVRGTGTVVTGTLWSGTLRTGDRARVLPGDLVARVRGLQVHSRDVEEASAGERTAVALTGELERADITRGQVVVTDAAWKEASTLTVELRVLADSAWAVDHGQRVRVHLGTAERMARVVLLDGEALLPGEAGWAQLRLEGPVVARAREPFVIRSYSPVTTIGGGMVVEPSAPKRSALAGEERTHLQAILRGGDAAAVSGRAALAGWAGEPVRDLPITTGLSPARCEAVYGSLPQVSGFEAAGETGGTRRDASSAAVSRLLDANVFDANVVAEGAARIQAAVAAFHAAHPLQRGMDREAVRQVLPRGAHAGLADALLDALVSTGTVEIHQRIVSLSAYRRALSPEQASVSEELCATYRAAGLAPPTLSELPDAVGRRPDLRDLIGMLEEDGRLVRLEPDLFIWREALEGAGRDLRSALGGRSGLGPADFKDVLPVTRKHLLPILGWFDQEGVTLRRGNTRDVPGV